MFDIKLTLNSVLVIFCPTEYFKKKVFLLKTDVHAKIYFKCDLSTEVLGKQIIPVRIRLKHWECDESVFKNLLPSERFIFLWKTFKTHLKLVSAIFQQIFIFHRMIAFQKL